MTVYVEPAPTPFARASAWVKINLSKIQRKRFCESDFLATSDGRIISDNEICVGSWELDERDQLIIHIEDY